VYLVSCKCVYLLGGYEGLSIELVWMPPPN
jgi:hypothetical protein